MALDQSMATSSRPSSVASRGRRVIVGVNVILAVGLATVLTVVLQYAAFKKPAKVDLSRSGANSLSNGTEQLLKGLDQKVSLTSLYYKTDVEKEDQARFRSSVQDLLELYQAANRGNVEIASINPLHQQTELEALVKKIAGLPKLEEEAAKSAEAVAEFQVKVLPEVKKTIDDDLNMISTLGATPDSVPPQLGRLRQALKAWSRQCEEIGSDIAQEMGKPIPSYGALTGTIRNFLTQGATLLADIAKFGKEQAQKASDAPNPEMDFLLALEARYQPLVEQSNALAEKMNNLPPIKLDDLSRKIQNNSIVVRTDRDARVLTFDEVWPPKDSSNFMASESFDDRMFAGEAKVTSALLQLVQDEQPAVVFVHFGGPPLFFGNPMMGQQQGPYAGLKSKLEEVNFTVHEWDLAASETPPVIEPKPSKVSYVVLEPTPPPPPQRGAPPPPAFGDKEREALMKTLGSDARAFFASGWSFETPTYAYADYLETNYGLELDSGVLTVKAFSTGPGKWFFNRTPYMLSTGDDACRWGDHPVVSGIVTLPGSFPFVSPIRVAEKLPEGVSVEPLLTVPNSEDLWGVRDVQTYFREAQKRGFVKKESTDVSGPFPFAVAATKNKAKVVVASSRDFFADDVAQQRGIVPTASGFAIVMSNPANYAFFLNSVQWLNDNEQWMNLGTPVDVSRLNIASDNDKTLWKVLVFVAWPGVVLLAGGAMWFVRRR